jgi:hypothetical protein
MQSTSDLPPHLESIDQIPQRILEIQDWSAEHPLDDHVYHLVAPSDLSIIASLAHLKQIDVCVAGSAALDRLLTILNPTGTRNWKASDAGVFFLNQERNNRLSANIIDIVQCKEQTVEELLINFDLPVCRVACNFGCDFWVSAHCLAAIYGRRQNAPKYLKDKASFFKLMDEHKEYDNDNETDERDMNSRMHNRFIERVKKYQKRGYAIKWIETDQIIPWVKNRFHYGEWMA